MRGPEIVKTNKKKGVWGGLLFEERRGDLQD